MFWTKKKYDEAFEDGRKEGYSIGYDNGKKIGLFERKDIDLKIERFKFFEWAAKNGAVHVKYGDSEITFSPSKNPQDISAPEVKTFPEPILEDGTHGMHAQNCQCELCHYRFGLGD